MRDAKRGLEAVSPTLRQQQIESTTYWSVAGAARPPRLAPAAHLLPVYDEYLIAYKDRDVAFDPRTRAFDRSQRDDYGNYLVIGGQFAGAWRWVLGERKIVLHLTPYRRLTQADTRLLREAANRLSVFASRPVTMAPSGA
jgi:hypothetical protein